MAVGLLDPLRQGSLLALAALLAVALVRTGRPPSGLLVAALWAALPPSLVGLADDPYQAGSDVTGSWTWWWPTTEAWLREAYVVSPAVLALRPRPTTRRSRAWLPVCGVVALAAPPLVRVVDGRTFDPSDPWIFTWSLQLTLLVYGTALLVASSRRRLLAPGIVAAALLASTC